MNNTTKETLQEAIKFAADGTGRSEDEALRWALDYLRLGGKENQQTSIDSANIFEAERLLMTAQREIDSKKN